MVGLPNAYNYIYLAVTIVTSTWSPTVCAHMKVIGAAVFQILPLK